MSGRSSDWMERLNDAMNGEKLHPQYVHLYTRFGIHELVCKDPSSSTIDKHGRGCSIMQSTQKNVYEPDKSNSVIQRKLSQLRSVKNGSEQQKKDCNVNNLLESFRVKSA